MRYTINRENVALWHLVQAQLLPSTLKYMHIFGKKNHIHIHTRSSYSCALLISNPGSVSKLSWTYTYFSFLGAEEKEDVGILLHWTLISNVLSTASFCNSLEMAIWFPSYRVISCFQSNSIYENTPPYFIELVKSWKNLKLYRTNNCIISEICY